MDIVDPETRSRIMSRVRGTNTKPELRIRRFLHAAGFRFRLHTRSLPGSPDITLRKYDLAIFVNGCFWHRHTGCHLAATPSTNPEKWQAKFRANVERDRRTLDALRALGWRVLIIWECGLRGFRDPDLDWLPVWIQGPECYREWPEPQVR